MTVKVDDRQKRSNSVAAKSVTITVDDVREPPSAPAAPRVAGIPGSTDSVRVTWDAPANTGPPVTGYDVQYREVGSGWGSWPHTSADRSTIITGLTAGTRYEVQVRARSGEGTATVRARARARRTRTWPTGPPRSPAGARTLQRSREHAAEHRRRQPPVAATRPRRRRADLHFGRYGRRLVRHHVDHQRRRPDTDESGAEPRGEVELLGGGPR